MGLNSSNNGNGKQIWTIKHGGFCNESKEPREGYTMKDDIPIPGTDRGDGQPKTMTKYLKVGSSLNPSQVMELEWYDTGDKYDRPYLGLKVHMKDLVDNDEFILDFPHASRHFNTFCKIAENINFTEPVEFYTQEGGTKFGASQGGNGIKWRYTKENPGSMPIGKLNKTTKKWDFSAQDNWLLENLLDNIIPAVNAQLGVEEKAQAASASGDRWADVKDAIHDDE